MDTGHLPNYKYPGCPSYPRLHMPNMSSQQSSQSTVHQCAECRCPTAGPSAALLTEFAESLEAVVALLELIAEKVGALDATDEG